MPLLSSTEYVEKIFPLLCKSMNLLPNNSLARICRVWARNCQHSFKKIIELLHNIITNRTMATNRKCHLQDNADIVAATKVMKVSDNETEKESLQGSMFYFWQ